MQGSSGVHSALLTVFCGGLRSGLFCPIVITDYEDNVALENRTACLM